MKNISAHEKHEFEVNVQIWKPKLMALEQSFD